MNSRDHEAAFELHPQLRKDTIWLGSLDLSEILLMNDSRYPWLILVPRVLNVFDVTDLPFGVRQGFIEEINGVGSLMKQHYRPERLNIAMLGNIVPQLHCHIVVRFRQDFAWPRPVWGIDPAIPYTNEQMEKSVSSLRKLLSL